MLGTHIWLPLAKICGKITPGEVQPAGHGFPMGPQVAPQAGPEQGLCLCTGSDQTPWAPQQMWQLAIPPWEPRIFKHLWNKLPWAQVLQCL